jgi:hypothetical protein
MVRGSNFGGGEISAPAQTGPGTHRTSYKIGTGVQRAGLGVGHPSPSSAEVNESVELFLCSLSGSTWLVLRRTLPLPWVKLTPETNWWWRQTIIGIERNAKQLTVSDWLLSRNWPWNLNPFSAKEQNKPLPEMQMFSVTVDKLVVCKRHQHSDSSLAVKPFCPLFAFLISSRWISGKYLETGVTRAGWTH